MRKHTLIVVIVLLLALLIVGSACDTDGGDRETSDGEERTELVLAADTDSPNLSSMVNSFNKNNKNYVIKLEYYSTLEKNLDQLRAEIIAGAPPDIYAFSQDQLVDVNPSIYEDLLPYLDRDPVYSRDTLVPSLLDAMMRNGSLHYIPYEFDILTFVARASTVGERSSITLEEAEQFASDMGPDINVFPSWLSRTGLLAYIVNFSRAKFVDSDENKCNFLAPEFTRLLEQCKAHRYSPTDASSEQSLLSTRVLQGFDSFTGLHYVYGTDYSFVGFPAQDGNGSEFGIQRRFSISAQSQHKDAAWEFVRMAMDDENQKKTMYFPSVQSELYKRIESVSREDSTETKVKLEQIEVDRFISLLNSITLVSNGTDTTMFKIISKDASAFFAEDITAQEAAELIQSKVSLYLSEQS